MKIGFVLDDSLDKPDGVQQYILTMGRWLERQGNEVHYLVGETHRTDIPRVHSLSRNVHVRFNQNRMSIPLWASKKRITTVLNRERFDVLHVQVPYSPMLGARVIRYADPSTAVIGTFHILPYSLLQNVSARVLGLVLYRNSRRFDSLLGASKPAARYARKVFHRRTTVCTNVVDLPIFSKAKPLAKLADGKLHIVFLGRLVPRKGCMELLKAVEALHKRAELQNVHLTICGKGPLDGALKQFVHDHHLGAAVTFAGFVSEQEKPNYLASAHLAVFPSLGGECFGIVLIEAMAAGTQVVIGGDNAGYRSVLGGRPDQLVDPRNTAAFADSLRHFLHNVRARQQAHNWQTKVVQQYDTNVVGRQLVEIYSAQVAKRRQTGNN